MCCGPSSCCPPGGAAAAATQAKARAAAGGPTPAALDPAVANAGNPVNAGGPAAAQDPSCCKPGAACCKPDAACCTPTGLTAGIGLDNFNGAAAPTPAPSALAGGPAAASAPVQSQAGGLVDILKSLQQMIAQLSKQFGVNIG